VAIASPPRSRPARSDRRFPFALRPVK
jgi:hypothetical protein